MLVSGVSGIVLDEVVVVGLKGLSGGCGSVGLQAGFSCSGGPTCAGSFSAKV